MIIMKKLLSITSITVLVLFVSGLVGMSNAVFAQDWCGFGANRPYEWRKPHKQQFINIERFADELGLTEEQVTGIKEKQFKTEKEAIELRSKIQIARLELRNSMQSDNPDENAIKQKIKEISKLRSNLLFTKVQSRLELRNILTSEQLEKLKELRKQRPNKPMHRGKQFRNSHPRRKFRGNIERFSDELGLTEEQLTTIKEKQFQTKKEAIELRSKIQIARLELRNFLQSENPDENTIKQKVDKIGELRSNLMFTKAQSRLELKKTLTPEQLEKLKKLKRERLNQRMPRGRQFRRNAPGQEFDGDHGGIDLQDSFPELHELEGESI